MSGFGGHDETLTFPGRAGAALRHGAASSLASGTVLAGRYRILGIAGRGGEGEIYRASDLRLEQTIALKILPGAFHKDRARLARLHQEVRIARRVSHPNVCRVYDIVEESGTSFLTMEWIDGEDLASLLRRKGRLPKDTAMGIARQIAEGLAAAHDEGVLHRDLKPSNVMVDERGVVRITDFGLAEIAVAISGRKALEGTPLYMAPEQLAGSEVTAQSDLYALGLVLFELFTGRSAFPGDSVEQILERRASPPPPPSSVASDVPRGVERVILRCLASDPSHRPPSGRDVAAALPAGRRLAAAAAAAQTRADRIAAFREELADLRRVGLVRLGDEELASVERHHERVLRDLVHRFDVDVTERGKDLSLGMRVVSLIGAIALSASVFFLFYRIWGAISAAVQVGVLMGAPLVGLLATDAIAARDRSRYFASMAGLFAFACFVIDVCMLWANLGQAPSAWGFLAWGAFGLALAYAYRLPLLLVAGLVSLAAFCGASIASWAGGYWPDFLERPEGLLPAGALCLAVPLAIPRRRLDGFAAVERTLGTILLLLPMFLIALSGGSSYLPFDPGVVSTGYQILGFAASSGAVGLGIARRLREPVYVGASFFLAFLFMKFAHWWWDWMPKYAFFLIVAITAMGSVWILKRLRVALMTGPAGAAR